MVSQDLPSLIAGDFNYIVRSHEKRDGKQFFDSIESREFKEFISNASLIDLDCSGSRFTWCNNHQGMVKV